MRQICSQQQNSVDWAFAESHGKAVQIGIPKHKQWRRINQAYQICSCCFKYIDKDPIPLSQNTKQLAFLGKGFPLYFSFMRFCMILLLVFIMNSSIMNIIMNLNQNNCQQTLESAAIKAQFVNSTETVQCSKNPMVDMSYISEEIPSFERQTLKIVSFVVELIVLVYIRYNQKHLSNYLDERQCNIQHFTVQIQGIPLNYSNNQLRIKNLIQNIAGQDGQMLQVKEILILQNMSQFFSLQKKKKALQKKASKLLKSDNIEKGELQREITHTNNQIRILKEVMYIQEQEYFLGKIIVSLNTQAQKLLLIERLALVPKQYIMKFYPGYNEEKNKIYCYTASEPADIIWQNIHYSKVSRIIAVVIGWIISIILLAFLTLILFFILKAKSSLIQEAILNYHKDPDHYKATYNKGIFYGYLSVIIITLFNKFILSFFCHHISHYQRHISQTSLQFSFSLKYMLGMLFTTVFLTLAVEAVVFNNYSHDYGVVQQQTFMSILNALFSPVVWLINPWYLIHKIKVKLNYGKTDVPQSKANKIMEYPEYYLGKRYAQIMKTMWFTIFYSYLIPIASIISLLGIVLYYFIDKYNLLRRSSLKQTMSNVISNRMMKVLDFSLLFLISGFILFDLQIRNYVSIQSIVMFVIAVAYLVTPLDSVIGCMLKEKFHLNRLTYDQAKVDFDMLYLTSYPLRKQRAMNQIIQNRKLIKKTIMIKQIKSTKSIRDLSSYDSMRYDMWKASECQSKISSSIIFPHFQKVQAN